MLLYLQSASNIFSKEYSVVKKAIQKLKDQGIEPPEELKKILTLSAKAWLNDLI